MNVIYQRIFDSSTTALSRIAACGLIGTILGGMIVLRGDETTYSRGGQVIVVCGVLAAVVGLALTLRDIAIDPLRSELVKTCAAVATVFVFVMLLVVAVALLTVLAGK